MNKISFHKQRGVTLVVSLVILITLTLLGITSIQRTTTELTMAGNQREAGIMFQAAEVGLGVAENEIANSNTNADFDDSSKGLYTVDASDPTYIGPDYYDYNTWVDGAGAQLANAVVSGLPDSHYKIEYLGDRYQNAAAIINIGGYGTQSTGKIVSIYRSTSRGVGLAGNSFRYIQSYFGKEAP